MFLPWNKLMAKTSRSRVKRKKNMTSEKRTQISETGKPLSAGKKWLHKNENRYRPEILTKCLCTNVRYVNQFSDVNNRVKGISWSGQIYFCLLFLFVNLTHYLCLQLYLSITIYLLINSSISILIHLSFINKKSKTMNNAY